MKEKLQLEQSMQEEQIRTDLHAHWQASAAGDANAEHDIHADDAICEYPQSGERSFDLCVFEKRISASRTAAAGSSFAHSSTI